MFFIIGIKELIDELVLVGVEFYKFVFVNSIGVVKSNLFFGSVFVVMVFELKRVWLRGYFGGGRLNIGIWIGYGDWKGCFW